MAHLKRTSLAVLALAGAASVLAVGPASATVPMLTLPSGAAVPNGDTLSAPLSSASGVFTTPSGKITCTSGNFAATSVSDPPAGTAGGALSTLTTLHFDHTKCTTTIVGVTGVASVELNGTASVALHDGASPTLVLTNVDEKVKLTAIIGAPVCDYGTHGTVTSITGAVTVATSSVAFAAAPVALISGSAVCPTTGTFTATFGPIIDSTQPAGNQALTIN